MASKAQGSGTRASATTDLDALRARVAELEALEAEHARAERVQAVLYQIAEAATAATDLPEFYRRSMRPSAT